MATDSIMFIGMNKPPRFNVENYGHWKSVMRTFMIGQDLDAWKILKEGIKVPKGDVETWTVEEKTRMNKNCKAMTMLYSALSATQYSKISSCDTAQAIWNKLEAVYGGIEEKVKQYKIDMLEQDYEMFRMEPNENITEMFSRFTKIVSELQLLGSEYQNLRKVMKILDCLPETWDAKRIAIMEARDLHKLSLDELLWSLKAYEHQMLRREELKQKKNLAFKPSNRDDEKSMDNSDDEFAATLERKLRKLCRKDRNRNGYAKRKEITEPKKDICCDGCKMQGHIGMNCPNLKTRDIKNVNRSRRSATVTSSSDEVEKQVIHLCVTPFVVEEDER